MSGYERRLGDLVLLIETRSGRHCCLHAIKRLQPRDAAAFSALEVKGQRSHRIVQGGVTAPEEAMRR